MIPTDSTSVSCLFFTTNVTKLSFIANFLMCGHHINYVSSVSSKKTVELQQDPDFFNQSIIILYMIVWRDLDLGATYIQQSYIDTIVPLHGRDLDLNIIYIYLTLGFCNLMHLVSIY